MAIQVVTSFIIGNSIDITIGLKSIRTGLPTDSSTATVLLTLYDPTGGTVVALQPMSVAPFTPPGYWIYTYATNSGNNLGLYSSQYKVTDTAGNVFISTIEPVFVLAANPQVIAFTPADTPVVATSTV